MPFPGTTFYRSELDHAILKELDEHNAVLNGFLSREHAPDGGHTAITAESVTAGLVTANVVAEYLRLNPSKSYTLKPNDPNAFVTTASDPDVSFWYADSPAAVTVYGMYVHDLVVGVPGHVQLIVNNSAFTHTYESAVVTNACRLYGCVTPVAVPPGGTIFFVYDGINLGWRLVGSSAGSGGGTLPPNLAFTDVSNPWSAPQTFPGLTITPNTFTVGGSVVTVNGPVTLPQTLTLPPNIAYLDAATQVFTGTNVFGNTNLAVTSAGVGALRYGSLTAMTADRFLLFNTQDANLYTQVHFAGAETTLGDWFNQSVKMDATPKFTMVNLESGGPLDPFILAYSGLRVNNFGAAAVTLRNSNHDVEAHWYTWVSEVYFGTMTNHNLHFHTNNQDTMYLRASDGLVVASRNAGIYAVGPLYCGQGGPGFIYVGPYRVDVTASCSIPGTGGGVTLPPNMAFTNTDNMFSVYQNCNAGLAFDGHDLGSWLNQSVRTDASPTFAGMTSNSKLTIANYDPADHVALSVNGRIQATETIETTNAFMAQGSFGITVIKTVGGVSFNFKGGILVA